MCFDAAIRSALRSLIIALGCLLCSGLQPTVAMASTKIPSRPITVEDVLGVEGIGEAQFSHDGRWLVYNQIPPYNALHDYSYALYAYRLSGHQLWIKDIGHDRAPVLQPGLDLAATNYLFAISPGSTHVVVLEYKLGRYRLIACEIGRNRCVRLNQMPDIRDRYVSTLRWNERIEWTSSNSFVFPTRGDLQPGSEMYSRPTTGTYLWREWNAAWRGDRPTSSEVISTKQDRSEDWAPGELIEFNVATGKSRVIAEGRYASARVSPDQKYIISARVAERERPSGDAGPVANETHPVFDRRYALVMMKLKSVDKLKIDHPFSVDPNSLVWASRGDRFAVFGWQAGETPADGDFYVFDAGVPVAHRCDAADFVLANDQLKPDYFLETGPARTVLLDDGVVAFARPLRGNRYDWFLFSCNGKARNLTANLEHVSGYPLYSDSSAIVVKADDGVYRVDAEGGIERLTEDGARNISTISYTYNPTHSWSNEFRVSSEKRRNAFDADGAVVSADGIEQWVEFLQYSVPSAQTETLNIVYPDARVLAASREARAAAVTVSDGAATRLLIIRKDHSTEELARINEHLNQVDHPKTMEITYALTNPADPQATRNIRSCLILPPDFDAKLKYPLLVEVYPVGSGSTCETLKDAPYPAASVKDLWTARGFVYLRAAIPLDFARNQAGPIAGSDELVEQTLDAVANTGFIDSKRVVLYGFSQGGVLALYIASQSDRFSAVISMNGWADFFSHYFGSRGLTRYFHLDQNGGDNRWRYECVGEGVNNICPYGFGASALSAPGIYAQSSPVALARNITAPVLMVHSDLDYFDMSQYDEMFGALYRAGKEARYVRYWGEGHGPSSPANIRDLWRRIDRFLTEAGVIETGH
ncbi:alpha/beta hydrolase family protein [Hyphococcus luteus]|uniref:Peptidase S9 prolyl oligopeptidase catalytic domain-containing protein n=1 Tax=Hyphococcus luteus TaxID=2058213 RepID=A0A2S7K787_9PROT|nr:prolyl oligopeptidase family serine peptidase [Marinicaulis flavus]PQA88318.1 hypothetical protein CW354_08440 [Marinicaulis flavus]